ncbi:MAG: type 2 isopentenyl-diphosphate Delta-isomerase [Balneolaceae bacterium]|nr:MAG: type 2 isopentenyl-diphosphate Delta-isomerase [Balneolaceae bacterium]
MSIQIRKKEHVDLSVTRDVFYSKKTGFERYDFVHNALPEINLDEIDLSAFLLGREFSFPLFISSMTGGYSEAGAVNEVIAAFCEEENLPFGVGSQRVMLENPDQIPSFSVVRKHAPTAFIAANIGGAQLPGGLNKENITILIESIRADCIIVHLNPLQELIQPEGDTRFKGILEGIFFLIENSGLPVIVKETGAGISADTANKLIGIGVKVIDVAGAGGTSWAKVENLRERQHEPMHIFDDWGIPTVDCLRQIAPLKEENNFELISSGGIRGSFDILKSIALGADFTATAQPVIKAIIDGGIEALRSLVNQWKKESKIALTLVGCSNFSEINTKHLVETK